MFSSGSVTGSFTEGKRARLYGLLFLMGSSVLLCWQANDEGTYLKRNAASWAGDLQHQDVRVRRAAAYALGKLNKHTLPYINSLNKVLLQDTDATVRASVANTLGELGGLAPTEVTAGLKQSMEKEKEVAVQRAVVLALGKQGQQAASVEAQIRAFLSHSDVNLRKNAAWTLGQLGPVAEASIPALIKAISDSDASVRAEAISSLGNLGTLAQDAIPGIVNGLSDKESLVQEQSILAIRKMGPAASAGISPLLSVAESDQKQITLRQAALVSLEAIWPTGHKDPASWQRLQALAQSSPSELQSTAQRTEKKISAIRQ